ncbi:hypothetical protein ACTXG6_20645 [Pseudonocardia sp. Cha107L01]|uniref:hypothetical protein n=1 Tax=Pseudonocardia sp. Cha107L01 TaxID=3457576 RepID=UPI00403ED8C2
MSSPTGAVDPGVADRARRTAAEAAARAGVRIGLVEDVAGTSEVSRFLAELWNSTEAMPAEVLRGIWHAGGSALAAYAGDRLVGAAVAVFEPPATRHHREHPGGGGSGAPGAAGPPHGPLGVVAGHQQGN